MKYFKNIFARKLGGFTLVESMVAISILSLAVTAPLLIAQKGIGAAIYSRDQITAFYLAQEAVEYVRNVRDTNRITGEWWLAHFSPCQPYVAGGGCDTINGNFRIDAKYRDFTTANAIVPCSGACPVLQYDPNDNLYTYSAGSPTQFTRTITLDNTAGGGKEVLVSVTISWTTALFAPQRTFAVKEYIFNF